MGERDNGVFAIVLGHFIGHFLEHGGIRGRGTRCYYRRVRRHEVCCTVHSENNERFSLSQS